MKQTYHTITDAELQAIMVKVRTLRHEGKMDEARAYHNAHVPMKPYLAKIFKDKLGADALRASGCNLSEAEAVFGPGWLDR
jgi:hypothetical protein